MLLILLKKNFFVVFLTIIFISDSKSISINDEENCDLFCSNGGKCYIDGSNSKNLSKKCICPKGYTGQLCEIRSVLKRVKRKPIECDLICYNGGTCEIRKIDDSFHSVCLCAQGFHGEQCRTPDIIEEEIPQDKIKPHYGFDSENDNKDNNKPKSYQSLYVGWILLPFAFILAASIVLLKCYYKQYLSSSQKTVNFVRQVSKTLTNQIK